MSSSNWCFLTCIQVSQEKSKFSSVAQLCQTLCDLRDCSTLGFPVHYQMPELTQTHVHQVSDAIQPFHPLLSPSPPTFSLSQHQSLLNSWLHSPPSVILEPRKIKSVTVSTVSPSVCHEVMRPDAMILVCWRLSFKLTFWLSSFTFIKRLFSSYLLSAITVVSSAYLKLLIFLLAILIPACTSSSPVSHDVF